MSFIKHHFNKSHHCTARFFTLFSKTLFLKNNGYYLIFVKKLSKFQILQKLDCSLGLLCQSISEAIPAKIFKKNHHFNQFILKKGSQKSASINSKSVISKTLQSGFWANKIQKGAYKSTSSFISNSFASHKLRASMQRRF